MNLLIVLSYGLNCTTTVVYWLRPGQTCHSKVMHRKEVTNFDGSYERKSRRWAWLKKRYKVKIPWYTHRLMHRKRVTWELHDSYFCLMMSKHAIPKIEWVIELLYNSVKTGSWRSDVLETSCGRESHHPAEGWAPGPPVEHQENENDTWLCPQWLVRSICCSLCLVSNSLSHANLIFF